MVNKFFALFFLLIATKASCQDQLRIQLVKDINPGVSPSWPYTFCVVADKLFFKAKVNGIDTELWLTDGTTSGTRLVKNINTRMTQGADNTSFINTITKFGNKIIFGANDEVYGQEPWISDGTEAGTYMIKDLRPENGGSNYGCDPDLFIEYRDRVYFTATVWLGTEVYVTDGTEQGTGMFKNIGQISAYPSDYTVYNGKLFFSAEDNNQTGSELWCTNGTDAGTYMVKDISNVYGGSSPHYYKEYNTKLFFSAEGDNIGSELWVTDGTDSGTVLFQDINPGSDGSGPNGFTESNGKLFFKAYNAASATELWCTEGNTAYMVKDINPSGDGVISLYGSHLHAYNNKVYFSANDGSGYSLWESDGTEQGTVKVQSRDNIRVEKPVSYVNWNGMLVFTAGDYDRQLWISDGTKEGTYPVIPDSAYNFGPLSYNPELVLFNNEVYFQADYNTIGYELYKLFLDTSARANQPPVLFPNPFSNNLNITIPGAPVYSADLALTDISGQLLMEMKQDKLTESYNTDYLSAGMYFLSIKCGTALTVNKILKHR